MSIAMVVQVCVGSSCYIKGSQDIIELLKKAVTDNHLEDEVTLAGSFCSGKCNREGVTVTIDDKVYTGVTCDSFNDFFETNVLKALKEG